MRVLRVVASARIWLRTGLGFVHRRLRADFPRPMFGVSLMRYRSLPEGMLWQICHSIYSV
jgi:hypothetical protein